MSDKRITGFKNHVNAQKQHAVDKTIDQYKREMESMKRNYSQLMDDYAEAMARINGMEAVDDATRGTHDIEPMTNKAEGEATVLAMLSDVHPFTRVRKATVSGMNEFNPDICSKRLDRFFKGVVRLTEIERSGQNIPNLVLHLGGDLIGNQIHEELKETNYGTPQEEVLFMLEHIESGLNFIMEHGGFKSISVVCSHGNHDRDTRRKQYENGAEHALTWTLYHVLKRDYKDAINFQIAAGYHHYMNIYGRKVRFHHGDAVNYNGGVGGPTIPINKAIAEWNKTQTADLDCFGHFHQALSGGRFFTNGSVIGYSTYAVENKCPFEEPRQWFILLDKKRWITSQRYIYLT